MLTVESNIARVLPSVAESGRQRRMGRLFGADGHTLIVGYDHSVAQGAIPGLNNIPSAARKSITGGVDGLQMGLHAARWATEVLSTHAHIGLVIRLDLSDAADRSDQVGSSSIRWAGVETALAVNPDAVVVNLVYDERDSSITRQHTEVVGRTAAECAGWGMPLMVEVLAKTGSADPAVRSTATINGARIAFELGADIVKVDATADRGALPELMAAVPVPVLIRGGAPADSLSDTLADLELAMTTGAAGAVYGRTVWRDADPTEVTRALSRVIHGVDRGV